MHFANPQLYFDVFRLMVKVCQRFHWFICGVPTVAIGLAVNGEVAPTVSIVLSIMVCQQLPLCYLVIMQNEQLPLGYLVMVKCTNRFNCVI